MKTQTIEVFGHASSEICSGCEGASCGSCTPGEKKKTIDLVTEFERLVLASEFKDMFTIAFIEATKENIAQNPDVEKLLSMASLEPVICIDKKIAYLGGFSPEGLLEELRKKQQG